jgi:PAS domain S-box-containing protein
VQERYSGSGNAVTLRPRVRSLRWHLLTLVAAVAVPLIALAAGSVWREHQGEQARAGEAVRYQARAIAEAVDREFGKAEAALVALANSSALARGDLDAFAAEARATSEQLGGTINLIEADGQFAFSTAAAVGERGLDQPRAHFSSRVFASEKTELSDLLQGPLAGEPLVAVAVPVFGRGPGGERRVVHALVLGVSPARLSALLREQGVAVPGAFVAVDDRTGRVVARTSGENAFVGRMTDAAVARRLPSQQEGVVRGAATFEGEPAVLAFAHAPWSHYAVVLGMPEAVFQAPLRAALLRISGIGAALLALGLLGARLLSLRILSSLRSLAHFPARDAPITGLREVDDLTRTLARASAERDAALARLGSVVETVAEGIVVADAAGRIVSANPATLRMFGYGIEEDLLGRELSDLIPTLKSACHAGPLTVRADELPQAASYPERELTVRRANGSEFPLEASIGLFTVDSVCFFTAVLRDVTTRVTADAALRTNERRYRTLVEAGAQILWRADPQGAIVEGLGWEALTGQSDVDLRGHGWADMVHPDDRGAILAEWEATVREQRPVDVEFRVSVLDRREGGAARAWRWLRSRSVPVRDEATGALLEWIGTLHDVHERRIAEEALRESERRLVDLVASLDLGAAAVCDLDGTIRFWSQGCARLYGWSAEEAVGKVLQDMFGCASSAPLAEIQAILLRDGEWSGDVVQRTRDGQEITVAARSVLRRDPDDGPVAVLVSVADVTALRCAQAELARLNRDLEARVREEIAAREAAQLRAAHAERMQALGQLAGGIAHDFNNVLQAVTGAAAIIERRSTDSADVRRLARMAADAAERGASITRRLLAFARRDDLRAEALDAAAVLDGLRDILVHTLGSAITVRVEAEPDLPPLLADKGPLETVLVNLATNARDAMPKGGMLVLSAAAELVSEVGAHPAGLEPGRYLKLTVRDTGTGMDAATLARVTEPFFTTKPQGQGTGLGLAMARGFAEQSGGALQLESEPGRGTTVTLWLPGAEPSEAAALPPIGSPVDGDRAGAPHRVLVVDDDPLVREVLAEQLRAAGFEVLRAASGTEALALVTTGERIDALVTGLSMPGLDGLAVIREAQSRIPGLPTVLLTGYAGDIAALAVSGAVNKSFTLLRKPVSGQVLAHRLRALLTARASSA